MTYKQEQRAFEARFQKSQRMPHDPSRPTFKKLGRGAWKAMKQAR